MLPAYCTILHKSSQGDRQARSFRLYRSKKLAEMAGNWSFHHG
jgi:hypothetical protein